MKKYKAIIFDVGDTLVKWYPNRAAIYSERLRYVGVEIDDSLATLISDAVYRVEGEQKRREQNGAPHMPEDAFYRMLDNAALSLVPRLPEPVERMEERLKSLPRTKQKMMVIPGVPRMLGQLKEAGYRLAIVSNHYAWLLDFLKAEELAGYFETIIISEVVGVEKPNVRIMRIALEQLSLPPQDCLYVGDHEMDVLCAKQAGLDMVWIASPVANLLDDIIFTEDYRIASVLDIHSIL